MRLRVLAREDPRYGYRRLRAPLVLEGWSVTLERVLRPWRREVLKVPQARRKRRRLGQSENGCSRHRSDRPDHVRSRDFIHDQTVDRRGLTVGRHEPGLQTPLHLHAAYSEHLFALEGEYTAWVGDVVFVLKPGDDCFITAGVVHTIKATGPGTSRGLNVSAPSGFARLIASLGTPDNGDGPPSPPSPDPETLARILAEIGDEILGPPGALPGSAEGERIAQD